MTINLYNTSLNYPNQSGINQIAYPLRDAIVLINPFFAILFGILAVLTISSYYTYVAFTGKTRFFNCLLASAFSTTVISFFFSILDWMTPIHVLLFVGITALAYIATVFYK